ncbi:hypothetical protein [Agrococcus sp. ARC_14]|uniref:DUF6993 domain-containing protein n=1 Tax=Agrococcus sp. ARC_14 TaxID=2919927 RepID=UPI001F055DF6|nr:hypothetical protein [Agrococcus sp. ARC_14]MCH1882917.1 hypothetical protein [Agrococcus sp. ARC_14]
MRRFAALALLASLALVGCSPGVLTDGPDPATPESGEPATGTPATAAPDAELDAFRAALQGQSPADPDALVAAVEAAGFDRGSMERTRELDSLGAPVTFLEVAVRVDDGCLIGQVGDGEPLAQRAGVLGGERCLVGDVIALD